MKPELTQRPRTSVSALDSDLHLLRQIAAKRGERIYQTVARLVKAEAEALGITTKNKTRKVAK